MAQAMLDAFVAYERAQQDTCLPDTHRIIGFLPGVRLLRVIRLDNGWQVWVATRDFIHGTWYEFHDDGSAYKWTCNEEGDECITIRPDDAEVHYRWTLTHGDKS